VEGGRGGVCDLCYLSRLGQCYAQSCRLNVPPLAKSRNSQRPRYVRWDLAEWSERCASIPKITGSIPSGGSELTFRSDLLLTARGTSTWALIEFACLLCYPA
jgi:hypothetical protein